MEQDNKNHLKETLNIKSKAHANEFEIRGIQREVEKHSLKQNTGNWKLNPKTRQTESLVKIQW